VSQIEPNTDPVRRRRRRERSPLTDLTRPIPWPEYGNQRGWSKSYRRRMEQKGAPVYRQDGLPPFCIPVEVDDWLIGRRRVGRPRTRAL
jgi:hypothetical protein